ncbi:MAG: recombinase family protein [Prochloron sp. SP5CPC1]|nr:recombinase family protein [Candidatus Paraprochloron terpiosi SP5CPC1]
MLSIWITGGSRSGKTTRLVLEFRQWVEEFGADSDPGEILVFVANEDNRRDLSDLLSTAISGSYPVICKTPLGFMSEQVILFWPLLRERLNLKALFPLRLRPETEQEWATRLWRPQLDPEDLRLFADREYRFVRRTLDLLQLAGAGGVKIEDIPNMIAAGFPEKGDEVCQRMGKLLWDWYQWCLARGLLTYGIIYELYWRYLLPDPTYQYHLTHRCRAVFADDTDDYPGIGRDLFEFLLSGGAFGVFTYNPNGKVRLGLNADPNYLAGLADFCRVEELFRDTGLGVEVQSEVMELVQGQTYMTSLPEEVQSIQTRSRGTLLRQTAETIATAVERREVPPEEIAIIAPGLDEIARYSLMEILSRRGIPVQPLNEQRPLIAHPMIRALLTLLGLVYPGLGRLVDRDGIAEMLVVLSNKEIDPVRGGLLADYCYNLDPAEEVHLLSVESFPRWDRLGYKATNTYNQIKAWIEETKSGKTNPIALLHRAIEHFFSDCSSYDRLAALRELMETAQHYWEVEQRLGHNESPATVAEFMKLLRGGTITADPRPLPILQAPEGAVTLATIFQYRSLRASHRWHFWLDPASMLWERGGAQTLFGSPLFLKEWSGSPWTPEDEIEAGKQRLDRIIADLLARVKSRLYLCHSDMSVNGREQTGPLLTLVRAAKESRTITVM